MRAHDDARLPARSLAAKDIQSFEAIDGAALISTFPGLTLRPVFSARQLASIARMVERLPAGSRYRPVDFSRFYFVDGVPACGCAEALSQIGACGGVTEVYQDLSGPDPKLVRETDPGLPRQGYLRPAPEGVDARYAWQRSGSGEGQRFVDLERGWTLEHQDLRAHDIQLLHGEIVDEARAHGTSVLGVVCAFNNEVGSIGIAPHVSEVAVVSYNEPEAPRTDALHAAIEHMGYGDVLLIEAQVMLRGQWLGPVEAYAAEYHLIELATALGITVVEAGGNGTLIDGEDGHAPGLDMDHYRDAHGQTPLRRQTRDSGAILVSAAHKEAGHLRLPFAPYGERIDCYAWGEGVLAPSSTAQGATTAYNHRFSGTSSAAAIVAGVALAVQSAAEQRLGYRLGAAQMRALLSQHGTPSDSDEAIGRMPDLRRIFERGLRALRTGPPSSDGWGAPGRRRRVSDAPI